MGKDEGDLKAGKINATKALKVDYYGAYEKSELAHTAIKNYIKEKGITINGAPWEVYVTDPEKEKDPSKILTEVYYPIK
jgi:effector-binding domain-containing protein